MFSPTQLFVALSALASVFASSEDNTRAAQRRDDTSTLYSSTGAPDLNDFDTFAAVLPESALLYALKRFESSNWLKDHIHAATVDGKDAAYYDIFGQDGVWKSYPVALDVSPSWIHGYNGARVMALNYGDKVTFNKDPSRSMNVGEYFGLYTGRPTEVWYTKDLTQDSLLDILKTFNDAPVVIYTKQTAWTLDPYTFFAVTNVIDTSVVMWYCELQSLGPDTDKCQTKQVDVKEIFDNLEHVGRLKLGEKLIGGGTDAGEDWESHKANVDLSAK